MIMNDDDIYIVHPEKKHIVSRISSGSVGYFNRHAPHSNELVKFYLDKANAKHGNGHTAEKGMSIKYKNYKPIAENTMDDLSKYKPFSGDLSSFRPAQIEEENHDDGTKKSTGNAFDLAALKKKKEDEGTNLRNHDKIKTSTGAIYKRKENAVGVDTTDVKQPEKRGRGRPPGKYGSYKKRIKEALEQYAIKDFEQLDELSTELLARYKKKAGEQASEADKKGDFKKGNKRFSGIMKATRKQFDNDNTSFLTAKVKKKVVLKDPNQNTKSFKLGESVIVGNKEGTVYSITESLVGVVHADSDGVQFYNPQHIFKIVEEDVDPTLLENVSWERWGDKPAPKESVGQWLVSKHRTGYQYGHQEGVDHILVEGTGLDASKAGQTWAEEQGLEKVYVTESFAEKKEEGLTLNEIFNGALRI